MTTRAWTHCGAGTSVGGDIVADPASPADVLTLAGYPSEGLLVPLYRVASATDSFDGSKTIAGGTEKYFVRGAKMYLRVNGRWVLSRDLSSYARVLLMPHHAVAIKSTYTADVFGDDGTTRTIDNVSPGRESAYSAQFYTNAIPGTSRIVAYWSRSFRVIDVSTGKTIREIPSDYFSSIWVYCGSFRLSEFYSNAAIYDADGNVIPDAPKFLNAYLDSDLAGTSDGYVYFRVNGTWNNVYVADQCTRWFARSRGIARGGTWLVKIDRANMTATRLPLRSGFPYSPDPESRILWYENVCYANLLFLNDYTISQNPALAELLYFDNFRRADSWLHARLT